MKVVTVCVKIEHEETVVEIEEYLANHGYITFASVMGDLHILHHDFKRASARSHRTKIMISDYIVVISPYDSNMKEEIDFALSMNKEVYIVEKY